MYNHLYAQLSQHKLLYADQYGFQAGYSMDFELFKILNLIMKAWENRQIVMSVMMDLSKAFNTLDHSILMT